MHGLGDHRTVSPDLLRLGTQTAERMALEFMAGAGTVRLQLLASRFYQALGDEMDRTPPDQVATRVVLAAAGAQCRCLGRLDILPEEAVAAFRGAVSILESGRLPAPAVVPRKPQLRVIQGGRA
jgi:hypothetical protein